MLNRKKKTYDLKKIPIMLCRFSNELFFAVKKCRILHIEYLASNKKISDIKLLISQIQPAFFKYEIKILGSVL